MANQKIKYYEWKIEGVPTKEKALQIPKIIKAMGNDTYPIFVTFSPSGEKDISLFNRGEELWRGTAYMPGDISGITLTKNLHCRIVGGPTFAEIREVDTDRPSTFDTPQEIIPSRKAGWWK